MILTILMTVLGGLGVFLLGMKHLSEGLQATAGGGLRKFMSLATSHRIVGVGTGIFSTILVQSSSIITVMLVGFVNSGLMQLRQAIPVIMGANIGTTATAWILSLSGLQGDSFLVQMLKPMSFSPILAAIAIVFMMFMKNEKN